jgi:putative oxidoreductase
MEKISTVAPETTQSGAGRNQNSLAWERWGVLYARLALGLAFLSAVASRFGLWNKTFDMKYFAHFMQFTAKLLFFMPAGLIPFFAWAATAAESTLGILLILGLWPRWVSLGAAILLALFATSMAVSLGLEVPMEYSVFSASSAAVLLMLNASRQTANKR